MNKIKLTEAIKIDGIAILELTLRRPKVRDRLAVEKLGNNDAEKEVALIANLADYAKIQGVLQNFLLPLEQKS
jgi:Phage tail assembly chaperone proteins, E, or 41 or 14